MKKDLDEKRISILIQFQALMNTSSDVSKGVENNGDVMYFENIFLQAMFLI